MKSIKIADYVLTLKHKRADSEHSTKAYCLLEEWKKSTLTLS